MPINQPCSSETITPNPLNSQSTCEGDNDETEQRVDGMLIIKFVYIRIYNGNTISFLLYYSQNSRKT